MRSSWEVARGRAAGALAACAVLAGCASTVGPEALLRSHAYEGPRRSPRELATVFARFNTFDAGRAFVCAVDARPYRRDGVMSHCPSVVYVTPGVHALSVEYRWLGGSGRATVPADLRPGLLYEVTVFAPGTRHAEVM
ncbi:MAG TPA: hypothetical protein VFX50_03235, partial [Gemmatimonadales bacterium]|nr:hypothetical protein [Gemmatimonadales bacterium]